MELEALYAGLRHANGPDGLVKVLRKICADPPRGLGREPLAKFVQVAAGVYSRSWGYSPAEALVMIIYICGMLRGNELRGNMHRELQSIAEQLGK